MVNLKRTMIIALAAVLALSVLGIVSVNAQDNSTTQATGTAWLGVSVTDAEGGGALIGEVVAGSPAETAGLQAGDVIKAVDSTTIDSAQALVDAIKGYAPGDEVTLSVLSNDQTTDVTVTLDVRPANAESSTEPYNFNFGMGPHTAMLAMLGLDTTTTDNGLQINAIADNSPLASSDLQVGDVITKINGEDVLQAQPGLMFGFRSDQPVVFTVLRDGKEMDISVTLNWTDLMPVLPGQGQQGQQGPQGPQGYKNAQQPPSQLGVQYRTLTAAIAEQEALPVTNGAQITQVFENTPAAKAGLEVGDIITEVDGDAVDEEHTLSDRLYAYEEGDTVTLTVEREGEIMSLDVVLGPRAAAPNSGQFWNNAPYGNGMMPYGNGMMPRGRGRGGNQPFWGNPNGNGWFWYYHHNSPTNPNNQAPAPEATPEGPAA